MIFKVMNKETEILEIVHGVTKYDENNSIVKFLIYKNGRWVWCLANNFKPMNEEDK